MTANATGRSRRRGWLAVAAVAVALPLGGVPSAGAASGDELDPSFGEGGKVVTSFGAFTTATAVVVQRDGRVVVAGGTAAGGTDGLLVARYLPDGVLDPSFAAGGVLLSADASGAGALAVRPDGRIVVAAGDRLLGLLPDGRVDPTFGDRGEVRLPDSPTGAYARLLLQPDGRIVVAGNASSAAPPRELVLLRFRPDGSPDPTFGRGGTVRAAADWRVTAAALAPGGRIVLAGSWMHPDKQSSADHLPVELVAARFGRDGAADPTFGRRGVARHRLGPAEAVTTAVAVQRDGSAVVGGLGQSPGAPGGCCGAVWRLRPDGSLDTSFGERGKAVTVRQGERGFRGGMLHGVQAIALDRGGRIVVTSLDEPSPGSQFGLARFTPAGRPDPRFGRDGGVTTTFGGTDRPWALALGPDGRIVVAGSTGPGPWLSEPRALALARYLVPPCVVPRLRGRTLAGAGVALRSSGCSAGRVTLAFSATVPRGRVISQRRPALAQLPEDAAVAFVVSRGPRR